MTTKLRQGAHHKRLYDEVIALALEGWRLDEIEEMTQTGRASFATIRLWITEARKSGIRIPYQKPVPIAHQKKRQRIKPEVPTLTPEDRARIADLVSRGLGLTGIAATVRKPYALVIAEIERQNLSRSP